MAVSVTHSQIRSVQAGPAYRTLDTVTAAVGIQTQVFVFAVEDDSFQHVATVHNMQQLLNTKAAAVLAGHDAYRLAVVQRDFESLSDAEEFGATLIERMKSLVVEYAEAINNFVGTTTATLSS